MRFYKGVLVAKLLLILFVLTGCGSYESTEIEPVTGYVCYNGQLYRMQSRFIGIQQDSPKFAEYCQ